MATKKKPVKAAKKNTGKPYEELVEQVIVGLLKLEGDGFKNLRVVRDEKLDAITRGEDGKPLKRQIDVYWEFELGGLIYRTIIQAKDLNRKITLGMVDTFKTVLSDLPGQPRGIMITKKGAQTGALKFAKAHGIGIYHLREAVEQDFAGGVIPTLDYYVTAYFKNIDRAQIFATESLIDPQEFIQYCAGDPSKIQILDEAGSVLGTAEKLIDEIAPPLGAGEGTHNIQQTFLCPCFVRLPSGRLVQLSHIKATITLTSIADTRRLFKRATYIFQLATGDKSYVVDNEMSLAEHGEPQSVETVFDLKECGRKGKLRFRATADPAGTKEGGVTVRLPPI